MIGGTFPMMRRIVPVFGGGASTRRQAPALEISSTVQAVR
jgi:hypothetical protein